MLCLPVVFCAFIIDALANRIGVVFDDPKLRFICRENNLKLLQLPIDNTVTTKAVNFNHHTISLTNYSRFHMQLV
jgi:hypothetical protein